MEGFAMHLDEGNLTGNAQIHKDKLLKVLGWALPVSKTFAMHSPAAPNF